VDILDSDSDLFDATGANDKVRKVTTGAPTMPILIRETTLPQIWVTTSRAIDTSNPPPKYVLSNVVKLTSHNLSFKIILVAQEKDGAKVEEVLDDFVKLIRETFQENFDLRQPGGAANTRIVDSSWVSDVSELDTSLTGLSRQGRAITLKAVKQTG